MSSDRYFATPRILTSEICGNPEEGFTLNATFHEHKPLLFGFLIPTGRQVVQEVLKETLVVVIGIRSD